MISSERVWMTSVADRCPEVSVEANNTVGLPRGLRGEIPTSVGRVRKVIVAPRKDLTGFQAHSQSQRMPTFALAIRLPPERLISL